MQIRRSWKASVVVAIVSGLLVGNSLDVWAASPLAASDTINIGTAKLVRDVVYIVYLVLLLVFILRGLGWGSGHQGGEEHKAGFIRVILVMVLIPLSMIVVVFVLAAYGVNMPIDPIKLLFG